MRHRARQRKPLTRDTVIARGPFRGTWAQLPLAMEYEALYIRGVGRGGSMAQKMAERSVDASTEHTNGKNSASRLAQLAF